MSRIHPECPDSDPPRWVAADVLFRQEPDEEEDEEEDDDKGREDDDDEDSRRRLFGVSALIHCRG